MKKVSRVISSVLVVTILLLGATFSPASAAEVTPKEISPVVGDYTYDDINGYGFSGYQQTWNEYNTVTNDTSIGQNISITFDYSIEGQAAADNYRNIQNVSFNQQVTTTAVALTFLPYSNVGAKIAQVAISAGSVYIVYNLSDVSFPLAAGDNLWISTNTVQNIPGTPTTTTTIEITDRYGNTKLYNRSVR